MWGPDNRIYFISDRDGRMNLFSTDLTGKETKQLTTFKDFDIKFPSIGKDAIVFEQAGYIWRYDLASGQGGAGADRDQGRFRLGPLRRWSTPRSIFNRSARRRMAQRVIAVARGDLFSVPMKDGTARNLTQDLECARARRGLVAGRQMDRLQLRRDRRERALRSLAGWQRPAATDNEQRRYLLLSGDLVARQQEAALERSLAAAALCRCRQQSRHAGRPG